LAYQIFWTLLVVYVYWLAYVVLLKAEICALPPTPKSTDPTPKALISRIQLHMEEQKPYLEPSLKMGDLAQQLNLSPHELSRTLNQGLGASFFVFVNAYRIQAFIELRRNPLQTHRSILQLAYQVGFNSKSSFNRAFRKAKGQSPSEFFKQNGQELKNL
ncbi:MAG: helix-turn-helix domain-containing protein, partial [Bacteroidota bacterium]